MADLQLFRSINNDIQIDNTYVLFRRQLNKEYDSLKPM